MRAAGVAEFGALVVATRTCVGESAALRDRVEKNTGAGTGVECARPRAQKRSTETWRNRFQARSSQPCALGRNPAGILRGRNGRKTLNRLGGGRRLNG